MHGGRGSGAPRGNRNAEKHGLYSARIDAIRRYLCATSPGATARRIEALCRTASPPSGDSGHPRSRGAFGSGRTPSGEARLRRRDGSGEGAFREKTKIRADNPMHPEIPSPPPPSGPPLARSAAADNLGPRSARGPISGAIHQGRPILPSLSSSLRALLSFGTALSLVATAASASAAPLDPVIINRITDQSFAHSEVMQTAAYLTDRIGGRMTNSPAMRAAEKWTQERFRAWGLSNVHAEGFEFGRGWWIESASVRMVAPRPIMLRSIPIAWTPATAGTLSAPIIVAPMAKERDFAEWRGKLAGKIVLVTYPAPPMDDDKAPPFKRYTKDEIAKLNTVDQPDFDPDFDRPRYERTVWPRQLDAFLKAEGAVAWARMSMRDNGLVHGEGYRFRKDDAPALPAVEIAAEDYRRLARLAITGPVTLEIASNVHYDDSDSQAYNILADLPGSDAKAGYVMAGAHLDSWVAADGATDNAAGSAIIMEAARILKAIGVRPKRTIRFALWSGEEQGIFGSDAYVRRHLATRPLNPDPARAALGPSFNSRTYPVTPLPGYSDLAGYFNIDNGSGRLRGIQTEGNFAAVPLLKDWLSPFDGFDATAIAAKRTGGTDHVYMQTVGLPGFQFIQDPLDYGSRTHHTSVDTYDHLRAEDMRQSAVILAALLLSAANSDKPIPAAPLPTTPTDNDPFRYRDPAKD